MRVSRPITGSSVPVEQPVVAPGEPGDLLGSAQHHTCNASVRLLSPAQLFGGGRFGVDDGDLAVADLLFDVHGDRLGVAGLHDLFGHRVAVGAELARLGRCPPVVGPDL